MNCGEKLLFCSRDIFSKREAESWWMENSNRICAIYHVPPFERATNEPTSSSEEEVSILQVPALSVFLCLRIGVLSGFLTVHKVKSNK